MSDILEITDFVPELRDALPETYRLLKDSKLKVHPNVRRITLHGSKGPAGGHRNDSDMYLSLITDIDDTKLPEEELSQLLKRVIQTSLENNQCPVELDMVAMKINTENISFTNSPMNSVSKALGKYRAWSPLPMPILSKGVNISP